MKCGRHDRIVMTAYIGQQPSFKAIAFLNLRDRVPRSRSFDVAVRL